MSFLYRLIIELESQKEVNQAYDFWVHGKAASEAKNTRLDSKREVSSNSDWREANIRISGTEMSMENGTFLEAEFESPGIVHLFKSRSHGVDVPQEDMVRIPGDDSMMSILFVPGYISARDLLHSFLGETVIGQVSHFRVIRSSKEMGYNFMLLMKFRDAQAASQFKKDYNGRRFNKMDPETCHIVQIQEIVFQGRLFPTPPVAGSLFLMKDPFTAKKEVQDTELPTCPVCLERLDSEVTGLATIPCQHTFHCVCLNKWGDNRCPVCRYSGLKLTKSSLARQGARCSTCGVNENLWICLICGNIGCGRYNFKHAVQHFKETAHFFAMDVATQRVWDYAGDNYVHRLVQSEIDGKMVEVGSSSTRDANSKSNKEYHLEYVQVLISQLESQREYYENKLRESEQAEHDVDSVRRLQQQLQDLKIQTAATRSKNDERLEQLRKQLEEEKLLSAALQKNLDHLAKTHDELQRERDQSIAEKQDLQEQVTDLMFFLESQEKLKDADESVREGTIVVKPKKTGKKKK